MQSRERGTYMKACRQCWIRRPFGVIPSTLLWRMDGALYSVTEGDQDKMAIRMRLRQGLKLSPTRFLDVHLS